MANSKFKIQNSKPQIKTQNLRVLDCGFWLCDLHFSFHSRRGANGYAALSLMVLTLVVSLSIVGSFTFFSLKEVATNRSYTKSIESWYVSEGGIEDAVYRVLTGKQIAASENLVVGSGSTTISVTSAGNQKIIRSEGRRDTYQQNLEASINTTVAGANFSYGAQVGDGGIEMSNTSKIIGSVFSNGNIIGSNSPEITGDAFVAYAGGSDTKIKGVAVGGNIKTRIADDVDVAGNADVLSYANGTITGNANADSISNCTVLGNASYNTKTNCTVSGTQTTPTTPPTAPTPLPMPIGDSQLDQWAEEAQAGGMHTNPCPYVINSGSVVLGPKKINCDMDIKGTATVTLQGVLWVAGNLTIQNSAILKLDPSYGSQSGLVIVDDPLNRSTKGILDVKNSAQILGSGSPGSYIMLISRNNSAETGGDNDAVEVQNTSTAPIYYVPHGSIEIHNSANLKEVTAWKLEIRNSATVTYESGLADVQFSLGPSGGYEIIQWKKVE